ncbi:beta 1-4 rhamnosyltransferase Cps2T [Lactobacillus taiwanensis]|jgi:Glycosyltransferase|uniref:beta 1-4 rhamnosyltransferase Cps2T n=1 Tax=Lactobacillus taiwanensis TaxID=508451 RepID=UPI000B989680|nr:glycosyltransferase family 1 protein [Lactobacillus taiwanensis]OYR96825.1 glycosyl transferase [Lactobacillus taiwanensis]OYS01861.1 glycosyl transferase [Lactobacillus taiwanensis]OYS14040.1 glycosyl transferase [Lactobacillus taiwanensis]OYS30313.1 glycosyl transferase [Lactobacillus taiwanensis]OYS33780.1 glycosyl transferase [Lactobacillus taiwanensis]
MKDIFIIGSKGIPAQYGGYETFVDELVTRQVNEGIKYHVACMTFNKETKNYNYNGAECQEISIPNIGGAKAILYDLKALNWSLDQIKKGNLRNGVVYILACRIGPFIHSYIPKFHKYGFQVWVNPDGHEWMRAKWSKPVRKYWKVSESGMVKNADLLVCDSKNIEKYIHETYSSYNPNTTFIAYGADIVRSMLTSDDKKVKKWYQDHNVKQNNYFLIVGRFVPENNYETMIKEFMSSDVDKDLVIITNVEHNKFYEELKEKTRFDTDKRIKFVGTVYDKDLLKYIRENAYGYIHGHSVGGTNPSLLEALADTKLNLLYGVGFNKEVGEDGALYWSKTPGFLKNLLEKVNGLKVNQIKNLGKKAQQRVVEEYSWKKIVNKYENRFLEK